MFFYLLLFISYYVALIFYCLQNVTSLLQLTPPGTYRWRMIALFASVIYPHYYAWWAYVNYYNDDYYAQCWHQLFFSATELLSTGVVLHLISTHSFVTPRKILIIMG